MIAPVAGSNSPSPSAGEEHDSFPVLCVRDLEVRFSTRDGEVRAVNRIGFDVGPGDALAVVGESGSGKSQMFMAVMGLLAANARVRGSILFRGEEILGAHPRRLNRIRGAQMSMIFQDPMTSLNPYLTIGRQLSEVLVAHRGTSEADARRASISMLDRVRIAQPARCFERYPHELSGGMRQRALIAMALLCKPDLLIADEPTTALDVTVQAEVLELLAELQRASELALVLVTHDLGAVAGLCDRVMVMYAGQIVESGGVRDIFHDPIHPYTQDLLRSVPRLDETESECLSAIPGQPPDPLHLPRGCAYRERCDRRMEICAVESPELTELARGRGKACHLPSH